MHFKCLNCWQFYKSSYKKSKFCNKDCKKQYYNDFGNEELSLEQKKKILKDRFKECQDCGFNKVPEILEIHHIVPTYKGGMDNWANLVCICPNCHNIRHFEINKLEKLNKIDSNVK